VAAGQGERARQLFEDALRLWEALVEADPENPAYRGGLSVSYLKLGDLAVAAGQGERARQLFEDALRIWEACWRPTRTTPTTGAA
jgi:tetratricopeptide (TPR) repeat protein